MAASGEITLEPAVRVVAPGSAPSGGAFTFQATDAAGNALATVSFDADETSSDAGSVERHFAFVIPMSDAVQARLQAVRVAGNGRSATRNSRLGVVALQGVADALVADDAGTGRVRLRRDASASGAALVLVRHAQTGEVLSFGRTGDVVVGTAGAEVDVVVSDGVRSHPRRLRVRGR